MSAPGYLLALYDTVEVTDRVHADGIDADRPGHASPPRCSTARSACGPSRIVIEVASSRQKYGRLAAFYDDHPFFAFEEGLLAAYAQSAAAALDAATALDQARRRGAATAALLRLARSLSEPASPRRIARIVAGAMTEILDVPATAVLLWDDDRTSLRVAGRSGWPRRGDDGFIDGFALPAETFRDLAALLETDGARIVHLDGDVDEPDRRRARARSASPTLGVAPIRAHHGEFFGLAIAAMTDAHHHRSDAVIERLIAIGDQAATAVQNAQLLEQIRHQAVHDNLTGLANRALFDEELDKTLARARRDGTPVTVLFVDLDDFKSINDRSATAPATTCCAPSARRLVAAGRQGDWVARLGGDEFTMLLPGSGPGGRATAIAERGSARWCASRSRSAPSCCASRRASATGVLPGGRHDRRGAAARRRPRDVPDQALGPGADRAADRARARPTWSGDPSPPSGRAPRPRPTPSRRRPRWPARRRCRRRRSRRGCSPW